MSIGVKYIFGKRRLKKRKMLLDEQGFWQDKNCSKMQMNKNVIRLKYIV